MKTAPLFSEHNEMATKKPFFQAKLTVNEPDDAYEQEADTVADKVMRMEAPRMSGSGQYEGAFSKVPVSSLQRKCSKCEEEEKLHRKEVNSDAGGMTAPSLVSDVISGTGASLDKSTKGFMESRMGQDFSGVRIHTDSRAAASAQSINALAYTSGKHIVFNSGQYQPNTDSGKRLLAHELVHTQQQGDTVRRYRGKKAFNFGKEDTTILIEDSFNIKKDKENKPWIETITVEFTGTKIDTYGNEYWIGYAKAHYYNNIVKLSDITVKIAGGSIGLGMTHKTRKIGNKVTRLEGVGYNSGKYSETPKKGEREGPNMRYSKDLRGNMNFAIFFNGGEAVHAGPEDLSSHGCVHIDWSNTELIQQMNYHSVKGLTRVIVKYI